ncbi:mutator type transposase, partial [Tanacetum coccineum]
DYFRSALDSDDEGKEFPNKDEVKAYIKEHSIETRREIRMEKNDNERVRAVCRGVILSLLALEDLELVEQFKTNPKIPISAVQEQLQQKQVIVVSQSKAFRANQEAEKELRGDYTLQYKMLRDHVLELQEANPNTTVKIHVQSEADHQVPTRVFKRIYVCLWPLKAGFKVEMRELLGLDGTFMKGPYLGQLLTAISVDPNNRIYPIAYGLVETEKTKAKSYVLLNNICEVFNGKLVGGRDKPIIATLEFAREYLMKRIANVNKVIDRCDRPCTLTTTKILKSNSDEAKKYSVDWGGDERWELTGIPCKHVVAANRNMSLNNQQAGIPEERVHPCYRPPKQRKKSIAEMDVLKIVKNGKVSRKHMIVTCDKCKTKDTDARSQSKKRSTSEAASSATHTDNGKPPTTDDGPQKKRAQRNKVIVLG